MGCWDNTLFIIFYFIHLDSKKAFEFPKGNSFYTRFPHWEFRNITENKQIILTINQMNITSPDRRWCTVGANTTNIQLVSDIYRKKCCCCLWISYTLMPRLGILDLIDTIYILYDSWSEPNCERHSTRNHIRMSIT